jgi:nucleotide-binding universal stress UspA family protein
MYRTILVPLDGSKRAESILPHVADLAVKYRANVVLLVVEEPPLLIEYDEVIQVERYIRERESNKSRMQSYLDALAQGLRDKGISTETRINQGPVVKSIINMANQVEADLVAMTSHGLSGMERAFYGSVAAGVLQYIDRPLLLIRSRND